LRCTKIVQNARNEDYFRDKGQLQMKKAASKPPQKRSSALLPDEYSITESIGRQGIFARRAAREWQLEWAAIALPCYKFWGCERENSTLGFARVTIIFARLNAGRVVLGYREILGSWSV
jgi:hypothetical protein